METNDIDFLYDDSFFDPLKPNCGYPSGLDPNEEEEEEEEDQYEDL